MAVQYQIDGNVFCEITTNWLCASVNEFLIKARQLDTDQTGNTVEHFQLNDGRVFTRLVPNSRVADVPKTSNTRPQNMLPKIGDSITQPR
jgi:hypothetical protein